MPEPPTTLQDLARHRRERDRPTHVHVVGRLNVDPPKGIATAKRVAHLLAEEDGEVRTEDYNELEDGDVAFVRIDEPPVESYEQRQELYQLASVSRVKMLGGIVVFTETVDAWTEKHLDARVWAESGGVDRVERFQVNPYEMEVFASELDGLVAGGE